jgi:hypothetical protein
MPATRPAADAHRSHEDRLRASHEPSVECVPELAAGQPTPEPTQIVDPDEHYAGHLRETIPSMFIFASMSQAFKGVDAHAYKSSTETACSPTRAARPTRSRPCSSSSSPWRISRWGS